jgi:uncharacterized protein
MKTHGFSLNGASLTALPTGALWWEEARLLCVSDLHLGKSERQARRGVALLPPYETRETLSKLSNDVSAFDPQTVVCLGDSFDDLAAADALGYEDRSHLTTLMAGRRWIWIEGNHDPGPMEIGGSHHAEIERGPLTFRHIAQRSAEPGEISGHYHPKRRLAAASRPCFIYDSRRLILPAYGLYTGGLRSGDEALRVLFEPDAIAVLTGQACHPVPFLDGPPEQPAVA